MQSWVRKAKSLIVLMLILSLTGTFFYFVPRAKAVTAIASLDPSSAKIGASVQLNGTITTANGTFTIKFDEDTVASGKAEGYLVNATFSVPNTFAGSHNVTLLDDSAGENYTSTFTVLTSYFLEIAPVEEPLQRQEGDSATINATVIGGDASTSYVANITVQTPTNASYTKMLSIATSNKGNGNATVSFPNEFVSESPNANTNYTGNYKVFFNSTLASATFFVGLTNATQYHRFDVVDIKALGYKAEENVTITISLGGTTLHSDSTNATSEGIIYANWTVPDNATIGTYTLNITSTFGNTTKNPPDTQSFTVPGFEINVTTRNRAGEPVRNVTLRIYENTLSVVNATSNSDGLVRVELEIGNYTGEAYYRDQKVGEHWLNISEAVSLNFACNLTNLRILVKAFVGNVEVRVPEAGLFLSPENLTATTNLTGIAVFHSLLPNVTYAFNVSRYGVAFNETTIPNLFVNANAIAWFDINITCSTKTLQINVTNPNADNQPINNVTVRIRDLMGGIFYEGKTNPEGIVVFDAVFGNYTVEVYEENGIKLNETVVVLFENTNVSISCSLYGLDVTVKVVDYFGQPIPNALVILQREGMSERSYRTQANGAALFSNIVGGSIQITVYLADQTQPYAGGNYIIEGSTTIEIKIGKYVVLAGLLIETIHLITAIIIILVVVFLLAIEVYRRKRRKTSQENEKPE
ncbi:MAG: hypothetical protein QHH18_01830 [Candidatus Bathyarchaeota archaeon]|nr:hypothetical protein [Candidatus Bathyarchaeota archaeon A05DMB-5]MDH7557333.1 hypothetical protein [Candidatus Bathyarchaeota archaeon]